MIINNSLNLLYIRQDDIYFNQNSNTIMYIVDFDHKNDERTRERNQSSSSLYCVMLLQYSSSYTAVATPGITQYEDYECAQRIHSSTYLYLVTFFSR